jgi:phage/plasmid-associated DNA primase
MMISYPYHIFDQQAYLWNQHATDDSIISLAQPFKVKVENDDIVDVCEEDLPPILIDYLLNVVCNGIQEHWEHLREYLANIILKPDEKTGIMLILYSQEKRLGKTTLCRLLSAIMNESNIGRVDNVKDAVGERGAYAFVDKKLLWFEETKGANDSASYASCMDRLKALITDPTFSYRSMFEGAKTARNHFELIACTNNLIGVAEDRMTVLHVSDIHRNDHVYYDKFDEECLNPDVLRKFIMYLSKFTVRNPMKPIKTALFDTMADNNAEPIEQFVNELPNLGVDAFNGETKKYGKFDYVIIGEAYGVYKKWHEENGFNINKRLNQLKFGARVEHYNRNLHIRKILHEGRRDIKVLTAPVGYFGVNPIDALVVGG